ncbi:serine hydrolase [Pseudomonas sp. B21-056]|jgi:beta-lactamase class A|uniref:serine hydrolase n=1 Tax=Pseudomonas sp. B21-056 TaxID=2895495 RepID=UPI002231254C|nr:serine hydrolase [Pseudomonas sp. B21-056]UZE25947.1 serine hydrolase [Pseudomonas sp. B21-056]
MQTVINQLNQICEEQPYITAWHVKNLVTGEVAHRSGHTAFAAGSTRKTSILMAVLREVHRGHLDLNEQILYEDRLREGVVSGTFKYLTPGFSISLRDALVQMIIVSDNVCTRMVLERIELAQINGFCQAIGMHDTVHRNTIPRPDLPMDHKLEEVTTISAFDQGLLYDLILQGSVDPGAATLLGCSPELCTFALEVLSWQKLRTKMASLLPADAKVAHKGGTGKRGRMDGGIVYRDGVPRFIFTGYTDQVPLIMPNGLPGYASAFSTLGRLARVCWDGFPSTGALAHG